MWLRIWLLWVSYTISGNPTFAKRRRMWATLSALIEGHSPGAPAAPGDRYQGIALFETDYLHPV